MTKDAQWRVRMAVFDLLADLALIFGKEVYMKSIHSIFITYLQNTAASVRDKGVLKAANLAQQFGILIAEATTALDILRRNHPVAIGREGELEFGFKHAILFSFFPAPIDLFLVPRL